MQESVSSFRFPSTYLQNLSRSAMYFINDFAAEVSYKFVVKVINLSLLIDDSTVVLVCDELCATLPEYGDWNHFNFPSLRF
jgi:hypothetical protein